MLTPLQCRLSLAYCPDPEVQFQMANMGLPYNCTSAGPPYNCTSAGIRQLYIRRKLAMVTGPGHLGFILEDIPFCLELSTCSLYTIMSPTW